MGEMKCRFILILLIFTVLVVCNNIRDFPESEPVWVINPPQTDQTLSAVGIGEEKIEAFGNALVNLAQIIQTTFSTIVDTFDNASGELSRSVSSALSHMYFGKIEVQSLVKIYEELDYNGEGTRKETIEITYEINYCNNNKNFTIKSHCTEITENKKLKSNDFLELTRNNCNFSDLIDELESNGFQFESYSDESHYFFLVTIDKAYANKLIEKNKDSDSRNK